MTDNNEFLDIEYLIFSAHKTATQTITNSLSSSGIKCVHAHGLGNMHMKENDFGKYLNDYTKVNSCRLKIISTFRDPLERIISSFFQSLTELDALRHLVGLDPDALRHLVGLDPDALRHLVGLDPDALRYLVGLDNADKVNNDNENFVHRMSIDELQNLFYRYCEHVDGWGESIFIICHELGIEFGKLKFSEKGLIGENEFDNCILYLLRFDLMLPCLSTLLTHITERKISLRPSNLSNSKWYEGIYIEFKKSLRMPLYLIERMYESRRVLMDLFYPGQYDSIFTDTVRRYGYKNR
jgi:hypothetical protein